MPSSDAPSANKVSVSATSGSSRSPSTGPAAAGSGAGDRAHLTEQQKRQNHINSEQKRRQAIREGFDRLTELVPGLEGQARSESIVLKKSVDFIRQSVEDRKTLVKEIEERGGVVPERLKT